MPSYYFIFNEKLIINILTLGDEFSWENLLADVSENDTSEDELEFKKDMVDLQNYVDNFKLKGDLTNMEMYLFNTSGNTGGKYEFIAEGLKFVYDSRDKFAGYSYNNRKYIPVDEFDI